MGEGERVEKKCPCEWGAEGPGAGRRVCEKVAAGVCQTRPHLSWPAAPSDLRVRARRSRCFVEWRWRFTSLDCIPAAALVNRIQENYPTSDCCKDCVRKPTWKAFGEKEDVNAAVLFNGIGRLNVLSC